MGVLGRRWGVGGGDLLKMHTQALRGNDFSTLLFATTWYKICTHDDLLAISKHASLLHHR